MSNQSQASLRIENRSFDIEYAFIKNLGLSCPYVIEVYFLDTEEIKLTALSSICLQITSPYSSTIQYFWGSLTFTEKNYLSNEGHYLYHLTLKSPLDLNTRLACRNYQDLTIKACLKQFLKAQGLISGIDYKLFIKDDKKITMRQINESSQDFFAKLISQNGLNYCYQMHKQGVCLMIADTLEALSLGDIKSLNLTPLSGMTNDKTLHFSKSLKADELSMAQLVVSDYQANKNPRFYQKTFKQQKGVGAVFRHALSGSETYLIESVKKQPVKLLSESVDFFPGQTITLSNIDNHFRLQRFSITINQDKRDEANQRRIQSIIELIPKDQTYFCELKNDQLTDYYFGHIESKLPNYSDLSQTGSYHLRLNFDEQIAVRASKNPSYMPTQKATSAQNVRKLSFYAGAGYGANLNLGDKAEVLSVFSDAKKDRSIILGFLSNQKEQSLVNKKNGYQHRLRSKSGNEFIIDDSPDKNALKLMTYGAKQMINLNKISKTIQLYNQQGLVKLNVTFNGLMNAKKGVFKAGNDSKNEIKNELQISSDKGKINFSGKKTIYLSIKNKLSFNSKCLNLKARDGVFKNKKQDIKSAYINLSANKALTILGKDKIIIDSDSRLQLKSKDSKICLFNTKINFKIKSLRINGRVISGIALNAFNGA